MTNVTAILAKTKSILTTVVLLYKDLKKEQTQRTHTPPTTGTNQNVMYYSR